MHVRLTFFTSLPDKNEEAIKIFHDEIVPVVKQQKGNIDIFLLEPTEENNEAISFSTWETKADADDYEATGLYTELVNKVRHTFAKPPVLKTYNTGER